MYLNYLQETIKKKTRVCFNPRDKEYNIPIHQYLRETSLKPLNYIKIIEEYFNITQVNFHISGVFT